MKIEAHTLGSNTRPLSVGRFPSMNRRRRDCRTFRDNDAARAQQKPPAYTVGSIRVGIVSAVSDRKAQDVGNRDILNIEAIKRQAAVKSRLSFIRYYYSVTDSRP